MLYFPLLLFTLFTWANDEVVGALTSASAPVASSCETKMREANCTEFFEQNDIPATDRRNCSAGIAELAWDQARGLTAYCASGFYQSWSDYAKAIAHGISGLWSHILENNANRPHFLELMNQCDRETSLECKRAIADSAGLKLTDEQLRSRAAINLQGLAQKRIRTEAYQRALRESVDFSTAPLEEKNRALEESQKRGREQWEAMKRMILRQLDAAGVRWACYNGAKMKELYCYGLGMMIDPLLIAGVAGKGLRLSLGLRAATSLDTLRKQVIRGLGYEPRIAHAPTSPALPHHFEVSAHAPNATRNTEALASMEYTAMENGEVLLIGTQRTQTGGATREKGLATYLFGLMLEKHPNAKRISTSLTSDNAAILERHLLPDGSNCAEAFKKTPAYKIRRHFNFTRIISARCVPRTHEYDFVVGRD